MSDYKITSEDGNEFLETPKPNRPNNAGTHPGFYTSKGKIYDANGNEFIARGINNRHVWFDSYDNTEQARGALDNISSFEFNSVRIVWEVDLDRGINPNNNAQLTDDELLDRIIQTTIDNKMVPMLELHDFTGSNESDELLEIGVKWWTDRAAMWKKYEKYLMINIANEFGNHEAPRDQFPRVYKKAITDIRSAGIKNLLIIDPFSYGQDHTLVRDYGQEIYDHDPEKNVVFSIHLYCNVGTNRNKIRKVFQSMKETGLPMVVGEFSHHLQLDANEPPLCQVDYEFIMEQAEKYGVGYYAWDWDDIDKGFAVAQHWEASTKDELTLWGCRLIYGDNGIRSTSKRASIFDRSLNRQLDEIQSLKTIT